LTKRAVNDIRRPREVKGVVAKRRITKKRLKEPDEFISWGSKAMDYALRHMKYLVLGALLLAAIIVGIVLWWQHRAASEEMALTLLGRGIALYQQEEKREEALPVFTELINDYPKTTGGKVALLYRGRIYMLREDYDQAVADFELFLKRSSQPFLRGIAFNALGNSYTATGRYQQAIDSFQQVLTSGNEWLRPYVLLQMGLCWEKLDERHKAADAYQESLDLSPPPPWGTLASLRLKKLEGMQE
jgi:tetratricopeptide (TPR) repeat protein